MISRDAGRLGQAVLFFETTEPSLEEAFRAYPPGPYRFVGWSADGRIFESGSVLSSELPDAPVITFPADGEPGLPPDALTVTWLPVGNAGGYGVEVDVEETEETLTADLPSGAHSFSIPAAWLAPGKVYNLDVSARGRNGNVTFSGITFKTAW